jgi:hypothetical protein
MKIFPFFFLLLYVKNNFAQDSSRILVKADEEISDIITPEKIYQYPKFSKGKIIFRDHRITEAMLNYNYLNSEIEFINPSNDTLAIASHQKPTIQLIILNNDTFYYDNGYLQQVLQTPLGKLAKKSILIVLKKDLVGAYGQSTNTTKAETIATFKDYYGSTTTPSVKGRENVTFAYKNEFFWGDKYSAFLPANKNNLIKLFPSKKEMISNYLKENHVDFKNSEALKKLLLFLE